MINPFKIIDSYQGDDFAGFLEKKQLYHIFEKLFLAKFDKSTTGLIIKYIIYTYSFESEYVSVKSEWLETKNRIFDYLMIDQKFRNDVVGLESEGVRGAILDWLNEQDNEVYTDLCNLKDLKLEFQQSLYLKRDLDGFPSYDQKFKNAGYIQELKEMIEKLRSQLVQNSDKLKTGADEVRTFKKKNVVGPEKFARKQRNDE